MNIYVWENGEERGPYRKSEIFALMKDGRLGADALGRWENETEWKPLNKVLTSGSLGLFTPEQIAQKQEELPEAPVLIADFTPTREKIETEAPEPKGFRFPWLAAAALILMAGSAWLVIHFQGEGGNPGSPAPGAERETASVPASSSPIEAPPQATPAPIASASTTPTLASSPLPAEAAPTASPASPMEARRNDAAPEISSAVKPADPPPEPAPNRVVSATFAGAAPAVPPKAAAPPEKIPLPVTDAITKAEMWIAKTTESPEGILVLCLNDNENAGKVITEAAWLDFARNQQLWLATISMASPKDAFARKVDYQHAEAGSGRVLSAGLRAAGKPDLPLFLYGRGGGSSFVSGFVNLPEGKAVKSWATFGGEVRTRPDPKDFRPALIATEYEISKVDPAGRKAFEAGRTADMKWTWLSVVGKPQERVPRLQEFVRRYFASVRAGNPKSGIWAGTDTMEELPYAELVNARQAAAWLPSPELLAPWKELMPTAEQRKDPTVFQYSSRTKVKIQPSIEMFLRLPPQYSKDHPLKGTLAFCTWQQDPNGIRKSLLYRTDLRSLHSNHSTDGIIARLIRYAELHDLAVLTWTTKQVWSLQGSTEELDRKQGEQFDRDFDKLSTAWQNGVDYFARNFGMPKQEMLLYGISRGGQWAHRLALRRPEDFLAVHVHIPSTFDTPTPRAANVLWLVTTGELESGYERAIKFYRECRQRGYPIIFKAFMGVGHADVGAAENLGYRFFDYALAMKEARQELARIKKNSLDRMDAQKSSVWEREFTQPPFVGDLLNQEIFPLAEARMVPPPLQVPLPTDIMAEAWNKN